MQSNTPEMNNEPMPNITQGPIPMEALKNKTFGERAVGLHYNSNYDRLTVETIKTYAASFIDMLDNYRKAAPPGEAKRYYSKAISEVENASYNAVRAATWED